jgi:hypothetical protein
VPHQTTWSCCHCGREIERGHNLAEFNLRRHEESCLDQQRREAAKAATRASRRYRNQRRKAGDVMPKVGQLGFTDFDGVPEEVVG